MVSVDKITQILVLYLPSQIGPSVVWYMLLRYKNPVHVYCLYNIIQQGTSVLHVVDNAIHISLQYDV